MKKREYDYSMLRGRIREKIGTEGEFARRIGRTPNFISKVFKNATYLTQQDIELGVNVLDIEPSQIGLYFFTQRVHKSETI